MNTPDIDPELIQRRRHEAREEGTHGHLTGGTILFTPDPDYPKQGLGQIIPKEDGGTADQESRQPYPINNIGGAALALPSDQE